MTEPGAVKGDERRENVAAELRRMRQAFDELTQHETDCGRTAEGNEAEDDAASEVKAGQTVTSKERKRLRNRKYGQARHRRTRKALVPVVAAGGVNCVRCGEPIEPGTPWDLGHDDRDPSVQLWPRARKL